MSLLAAPSDGMTRALQAERAKVGLLEKKVRLLEAEINERKQGLPRAPTWAGVAAEPPASVVRPVLIRLSACWLTFP